MTFKVIILCATALLIQTTLGQCIRNVEVTSESCQCSSQNRSGTGSGNVRAVSLGCFNGGNFISNSDSSNIEGASINCVTNADATESYSAISNTRSGTGSGTVRAVSLGCFNGGNFISNSDSSNIEGASINCVTNADSSESCSIISKTRSATGSGSVRAIGIGNFRGGKFTSGSGSSNIESASINSVTNAGCSVTNAGRAVGSLVSSGGPFIITCNGPVAPSGISVNAYSDLLGDLIVYGQLPFLSAVVFDGSFQTDGQATVAYGCGDENIAIREVIGDNSPGSCGYIRL